MICLLGDRAGRAQSVDFRELVVAKDAGDWGCGLHGCGTGLLGTL